MSEILYGFMFVGIVLANVIVLADDNWRERQIVPHTIRIFVGWVVTGVGGHRCRWLHVVVTCVGCHRCRWSQVSVVTGVDGHKCCKSDA